MSRRVLVIDDDDDLAAVAEAYLTTSGFEVQRARDGVEGVEAARAYKPDLVMVDIMMPKMHGFQVCEKLRSMEGLEGLKILVCSSKSFDSDKQIATEVGADDYLVKPYQRADLMAKVGTLLGDQPAGG